MIFRCFQHENLKLLNPTALEVNDAFFLATHSPVRLGRMRGSNLTPSAATPIEEEEYLRAFRDSETKFIFSIVRGTTGSGKSHLIRWVYSRLASDPLPHTRLFLIPRAGANLRQIIERIIEGLQGKFFDEIRQDLARGQEKLTSKGLRETLLDSLAVQVDPSSFTGENDPLEGLTGDARDVREYLISGLPDLFRDRRFRRQFVEPGNIVDELVNLTIGSGGSRSGRERPRQFTELDFKLTDKLTPEDLRGAATDETLQFAVDLNQNEDLRQEAAKYVNSCLSGVIQSLLDIRGSNFTDIFRRVRKHLGPSQQLIVLIEDIAAFEFIDRQLMESLIEQPDAELCPLKSAVGVTDGYFEKIDFTHIERANFLLTLDVPTEDPKDYLFRFATTYLNALRTPLSLMEEHAKSGTTLPNACMPCPFRSTCHPDFGTYGSEEKALGLWPFNPNSLPEMQKFTHGTHAGEFNPRAFLDAVLRFTLEDQAASFEAGKFPTLAYRRQFGPPTSPGAKVEALKKQFRAQFEQAQVIQELWGDVPPGVYEAFGIKATPPPGPDATPPVETKPATSAAPEPKYPKWLADTLKALDAWYNGMELWSEPRDTIRRIIRSAIVAHIDWAANDLNEIEWGSLFDPGSINFEGQTRTLSRPIVVTISRTQPGEPEIPTPLAIQGLLLASQYGGWEFQFEGQDGLHFLQLAVPFVERLAEQLLQTIRTFQSKGKVWNPLPASVEILALGALIQGHIDETDSVDAWLDALFIERSWEPNPIGPPGASFEKLVEGFGQSGAGQGFSALREKTLELISLSSDGKTRLIGSGKLLPILAGLRGGLPLLGSPIPADLQGGWTALRHLRRTLDQHLRPAVEEELDILQEWSNSIEEDLSGLEFSQFIRLTREFLTRAEKLKVYRGTAATKAGIEEPRQLLKELEPIPLDQIRGEVRELLRFAGEDFRTDSERFDRLLPRMARLRHDLLERWTEFRKVLQTVFERTEQQIDRAGANEGGGQFRDLEERVSAQIQFLHEIAVKLLPPTPPPATPATTVPEEPSKPAPHDTMTEEPKS